MLEPLEAAEDRYDHVRNCPDSTPEEKRAAAVRLLRRAYVSHKDQDRAIHGWTSGAGVNVPR